MGYRVVIATATAEAKSAGAVIHYCRTWGGVNQLAADLEQCYGCIVAMQLYFVGQPPLPAYEDYRHQPGFNPLALPPTELHNLL